ncbi:MULTISPECIES: helix-turn-helix transcriptional regulator [Pseudonocardia]|uniref:HTH domain protein n=2 Tax=Pseudonocardia TaxID=1847 RepID=A0A1Y2MK17_PSEAH|nr:MULTISPECIES: WYL domain-containing protein [Pseudonocardia]OSY35594.1 HTH domain protein [Pseudonocardia autotrophica]TDN76885.1 putative DNA-binding transcriptional regulator YafY [Pseudonocardia autotrophica]BBG00888.1 DeoR family transcriptional regulator [Pseudonocardia autotrophica]GEC27553.1 DeoR family transcriptional regulator [Pseudonocardia saturnea]
MLSASHRLLQLLSVLSTRPEWTGAELAARLDVHERTVRRDVVKLRELGYGVEAVTGPLGGYRLGAGSQMPPLNLDDDEALATAVALRRLAWEHPDGEGQSALTALLKLQRSLPRRAAESLGRFDSVITRAGGLPEAHGEVALPVLTALAAACRARDRIRFRYRDRRGNDGRRAVEPAGLVRTAHRWYLAAWDLDRDDWRVFRADRITDVAVTGPAGPPRREVDATALVEAAITSTPYEVYADVELHRPVDEVRALVPATIASHVPDGPHRTATRLGGPDARWIADYLVRLGVPFRVLGPAEVRELVVTRLQDLLTLQASAAADDPG